MFAKKKKKLSGKRKNNNFIFSQVFLGPLRMKQPPIVSRQDLKAVFSEIEVICGYNSMLLKQLEDRMKNWSETQLIGDIFIKMIDFLKTYSRKQFLI